MYDNIPKMIVPKVVKIALSVWVFNQENISNNITHRKACKQILTHCDNLTHYVSTYEYRNGNK